MKKRVFMKQKKKLFLALFCFIKPVLPRKQQRRKAPETVTFQVTNASMVCEQWLTTFCQCRFFLKKIQF
jgi:hypothetical protein